MEAGGHPAPEPRPRRGGDATGPDGPPEGDETSHSLMLVRKSPVLESMGPGRPCTPACASRRSSPRRPSRRDGRARGRAPEPCTGDHNFVLAWRIEPEGRATGPLVSGGPAYLDN